MRVFVWIDLAIAGSALLAGAAALAAVLPRPARRIAGVLLVALALTLSCFALR